MKLKDITSTEPKILDYKEQQKAQAKVWIFMSNQENSRNLRNNQPELWNLWWTTKTFLEKVASNQPEIWNSKEQTKEFEKT